MPRQAEPTPHERLSIVLSGRVGGDEGRRRSTVQRLTELQRLRERLDRAERQLVRQAIREGAAWRDVGGLFGISKQAAWNRWGRG